MKMLAFLVTSVALMLSGCMTSQQTVVQSVEYTCASATAALKTVITFDAKLTPAQRTSVTTATKVIDPICSQPNVPSVASTAGAAFQAAVSQLATVATAVTPK